jgi:hypothetical protein
MPHTPGPWAVREIPKDKHHTFDGFFRVVDATGRHIATVPTNTVYGLAEGDGINNANLIAACPDLLAACEAAIQYDEGILGRAARGEVDLRESGGGVATGEDLDALYNDWITKARAAIAKANQ